MDKGWDVLQMLGFAQSFEVCLTSKPFRKQKKITINSKRLNLMVPCKKVSISECFPNNVTIERAFAEDVTHSGCQLDLNGLQVTDLQVPDLRVKADGQQILLK